MNCATIIEPERDELLLKSPKKSPCPAMGHINERMRIFTLPVIPTNTYSIRKFEHFLVYYKLFIIGKLFYLL